MRAFARLFACATLSALLAPSASQAQQVTMPPLVRMVVPFAAGAGTDVTARALAQQLGQRLGSNVIVDNRPGASGMIGTDAVVRGPKDGSMLLLSSVSLISAAATKPNMPFDLVNAIKPVAILGEGPMLIAVAANSPIKTPADFVAAARARQDAFTHGTGGVGTIAHMAAELLNDAGSLRMKHIPYRGAAPAVIDLASGIIDTMIAAQSTFAAQVKGGRLRVVALTSAQPSASFPGVPTMASVVPGYAADLWQAVWVPTGTPQALVERYNREINEAMKSPEMRELLQADGFATAGLKPDAADAKVRNSYATWKKLAVTKNIVIND